MSERAIHYTGLLGNYAEIESMAYGRTVAGWVVEVSDILDEGGVHQGVEIAFAQGESALLKHSDFGTPRVVVRTPEHQALREALSAPLETDANGAPLGAAAVLEEPEEGAEGVEQQEEIASPVMQSEEIPTGAPEGTSDDLTNNPHPVI